MSLFLGLIRFSVPFPPPLLPWVLNLKGKCGNSSAEATGVRVFLVDPHDFQRPTGQTGPKRGVADEPEVTP